MARVCAVAEARAAAPTCRRTDAGGDARSIELEPGRYLVVASAPGWIPARPRNPILVVRGELARVDLELVRGGVALSGVVEDLTGGTIEDALVLAYSVRRAPGSGIPPLATASSDAEGRFTLFAAPGPVRLVAQASGYASARMLAHAPSESNEIIMVPGGQILGRVLWQEGGPVERARVSAVPAGEDEPRPADTRSVLTTADGEYEISNLPPGRYALVVRVAGGVGRSPHSLELHIGESVRAPDISVIRAPALKVAVRYSDDSPCVAGSVALREQKRWELVRASIAADGVAWVPGALPGRYSVTIDCLGAVAPVEAGELAVPKGIANVQAVYRVERGLTLTGTLQTTSGTAVAGRSIDAVLVEPADSSSRVFGTTDARGGFELTGLMPDGKYALFADESPVEPSEITLPSLAPVSDVVLTIPDPAVVYGTVALSGGSPVPGVAVLATSSDAGSLRTLTDATGAYRFEAMTPSEYTFNVQSESAVLAGPPDVEPTKTVTLAPGDDVEVSFTVERSDGEISGTVVGSDGAPIADAGVGARRVSGGTAATQVDERQLAAASGSFSTLSDSEGRFVLSELAVGSYTVYADGPGGGRATAAAVAVGANIELRLEGTSSVRGKATYLDGKAPQAFVATLAGSGNSAPRLQEMFVGTNGRWEFEDLPEGKYKIGILADQGSGRAAFSISKAREEVTVELVRGESLRGKVVRGLDGGPVPDHLVFVESVEGWADALASPIYGRHVKTSPDGTFVYENPPLGTVQVRAVPSSPASQLGDNIAFVTVTATKPAFATIVVFPESTGDGDIGFTWAWPPLETSPYDFKYVVDSVEPGGPAAAVLQVGDEIVLVNEHDVTEGQFLTLLRLIPPRKGTRLEFITASEHTFEIVAR